MSGDAASKYEYSVFISYRYEGDRVTSKLYKNLNGIAVSRSLLIKKLKKPVEVFGSAGASKTLLYHPARKPYLDESCFRSGSVDNQVESALNKSKLLTLIGTEYLSSPDGKNSYVNGEVAAWCGWPWKGDGDQPGEQIKSFNNTETEESFIDSLENLEEEKIREIKGKFERIIPIVDCDKKDIKNDGVDKYLPWAYTVIRDKLHNAEIIDKKAIIYKTFTKHNDTDLARFVVASLLGCDKSDVDNSIRKRKALFGVLIGVIIAILILLGIWLNTPPVEISADGLQWNGPVVAAGDSMSFEISSHNGIISDTLSSEDFVCDGFQPQISVNDGLITIQTDKDFDISKQDCVVFLKRGRYHSETKLQLLQRVNPKTQLFSFSLVSTENEILTDVYGGFDKVQSGQSADYTVTFSSAVPLTRSPDFERYIKMDGFNADVAVTWVQPDNDNDYHNVYDNAHEEVMQCHILFHNVHRTEEKEAAFFYIEKGAVTTEVGTISAEVYDTNRDGTRREMRIVDYAVADLSVPTPILVCHAEEEVPVGGAFLTTLTFLDMITGETALTRENALRVEDLFYKGFDADQVDIRELTGGGYWILFSGVRPCTSTNSDQTMALFVKPKTATSQNGRPSEFGYVVLDFDFVSSPKQDEPPTATLTALTDPICGQKMNLQLTIEDDHTLPMFSTDKIRSVCSISKGDKQIFNAITVQEDGGWNSEKRIYILSFYSDQNDADTEYVIRWNHEAQNALTDVAGNPISAVEYRSVFQDMSTKTASSITITETNNIQNDSDNKTQTSFIFDIKEGATIPHEGSFRFCIRYTGDETLNINWKYKGSMLFGERFWFDYTIAEGTEDNEFWVTLNDVKNTTGASGNKYLLLNREAFVGWTSTDETKWIISPPLQVEPDPTLPEVIVRINGKVIEENAVEIDHEHQPITPITVKQCDMIVIEAKSKNEGAVCQIDYKVGQGKEVENAGDLVLIPVPDEFSRFSLQVNGWDERENQYNPEWQYYMIEVEEENSEAV